MTGLQIFILICVINAVLAASTQCFTVWYFSHHFDTLVKLQRLVNQQNEPSMARMYITTFLAWPIILLFMYIIHYHPDKMFDNDYEATRKQFDERFREWNEENKEDENEEN